MEIQEYKDKLYEMNYGISYYYNKNEKTQETTLVGILKTDDSDRFSSGIENMKNLKSVILSCNNYKERKIYKGIDGNKYRKGYIQRLNYIENNPNLEIVNKGKNKDNKYYIVYRIRDKSGLRKRIEDLKLKAYNHIENDKMDEDDYGYKKVNFSFDYQNKMNKVYKFNEYNKKLRYNAYPVKKIDKIVWRENFKVRFMRSFMIFYPNALNKKMRYFYNTLFHLKDKNNGFGNIGFEYRLKDNMNKDIGNWIYLLSEKMDLQKLVNMKGKKEIQNKIIELLEYSADKTLLTRNITGFMKKVRKQLKDKRQLRWDKTEKDHKRITDYIQLYDTYENKRSKNAQKLRKKIDGLQNRIKRQVEITNKISIQLVVLKNFIHDFKDKKIGLDYMHKLDKLVYNLLVNQIRIFYTNTLVRYVNTQRNKIELIKLGLNNMDLDFTFDFNKRFDKNKIDYDNKFDEILDKYHEKCRISKDCKISVKGIMNGILKCIRFENNVFLRNWFIYKIEKITRKFQDVESIVLNS